MNVEPLGYSAAQFADAGEDPDLAADVAAMATTCLIVDKAVLDEFCSREPAAGNKIYREIIRVLAERLQALRTTQPDATLLDAWLHAASFNYEPLLPENGNPAPDGQVQWTDPRRSKGSGWPQLNVR